MPCRGVADELPEFAHRRLRIQRSCREDPQDRSEGDNPAATPTGYKQAHELWMKLSGPKWEKPNPKQQAWIDVNARQTKTAEKLAEFVRLDLVKYEDFELPSDDLSVEERVRALNVINSRLDTIWEERNWSPEYRAKVALHRVGELQKENEDLKAGMEDLKFALRQVCGRLHALEQEPWLRNDAA
jgi:hypothetical protein